MDDASRGELDVDPFPAAAHDPPTAAVHHPEAPGIHQRDDLVADSKRVAVRMPLVIAELAGVTHSRPGRSVQQADLVAASSDEQRVRAALAGGPPTIDNSLNVCD